MCEKTIWNRFKARHKHQAEEPIHFLYCILFVEICLFDRIRTLYTLAFVFHIQCCVLYIVLENTCLSFVFVVLTFLSLTVNIPYFASIIFKYKQKDFSQSIHSFIHSEEYHFRKSNIASLILSLSFVSILYFSTIHSY